MAGTKEGNLKGAATKIQIYGPDHFSKLGAEGGKKSKGRTLSPEVRKKISQSKRKKGNHERSNNPDGG